MIKIDDFPWRKYTKQELHDEYFKLKDKLSKIDVKITNIQFSRIGLKCTNYFFQYERMKTPTHSNKNSCYDMWFKDKNQIITYAKEKQLSYDLFATITFLKHPSSQFPIFVSGQIYKYFGATNILDPYCGWGERCLAAMALDINYIGIDSNTNLIPYYDKMINYYPTKSKIEILYDKCENIDIDKLNFDFVLTSPPYWNDKHKITEKYNKCENDYYIFMNQSLIPVIKKCLKKKNIWICINIPENMYNDLIKLFKKCDKIINFPNRINNKGKNHGTFKTHNIYCYSS